ncbi:MAG: hypothetical protein ACTSP4_15920 [Candidatus Hodarchaeales archaeon]
MKSQETDRCDLVINARYSFKETEFGELVPVIPVRIHRKGMRRSIDTDAMMDTGFDCGLLLSKDIRDLLYVIGDPEKEESLGAGGIEIACEIFLLSVKIFNRWFRLEGYAPLEEGFETIIGREITDLVNICIRGPEKSLIIANPGLD